MQLPDMDNLCHFRIQDDSFQSADLLKGIIIVFICILPVTKNDQCLAAILSYGESDSS